MSAKTSISVVQEYSWLVFPWLNPSFYLFQLRAELELSSLLLFPLSFRGGQAEGFLLGMAAGSQLDSLLLPSANAFIQEQIFPVLADRIYINKLNTF